MEGTANFANVITYPTTGKTTDIRCRMQQRLTLLLTCSIATRRRALARFLVFCSLVDARFLVFCSLVDARFFGFLIGISISTPSRVKPRKPRSCRSELPCGKGLGVASAMRLSCTMPGCVTYNIGFAKAIFNPLKNLLYIIMLYKIEYAA